MGAARTSKGPGRVGTRSLRSGSNALEFGADYSGDRPNCNAANPTKTAPFPAFPALPACGVKPAPLRAPRFSKKSTHGKVQAQIEEPHRERERRSQERPA